LVNPLYESLTTASAATLAKVTPIVDVTIRNLTLRGSHNTGATSHGIHLLRAARCAVEDVDCRNFTGAGLYLDTGYCNGGRRIRISECGSASVSDLECRRNTGFRFADIDSYHATGFGPQFAFTNGGLVANLRSVGASGRAV